MEKQYPKFVVGSFIINTSGELFLRTTPSQENKYTCINSKVLWGKTIQETVTDSVLEKTNLKVSKSELIGLTDGLNIPMLNGEFPANMIFADYKVFVEDTSTFKQEDERGYKWLKPEDWLKLKDDEFGPYIKEIIEKLV